MGGSGSSNIEPSEVFGPYLVYERLGVGGMATVHRAKKRGIEGFERVCALKRMLPHLAEDGEFVRSFVREAKLAAMLQHANTVQIYELGRVGRVYFMAMEYIEGYDVRKLLRQSRRRATLPPVAVVLAILGELCDALDYAHNRTDDNTGEPLGIVHRDVSPSNLLVTHAGHLKVIDFGIAKATSNALKTDTGRVKGKLGYMSPEAIQGRKLDARSDIFSAGVIAHELLAVRPLFASRNDYDTLTKIQRGEVIPPSTYNKDVPAELDDLVLKALAKEPNERFHSAAEMREALQQIAMSYALPASSRTTATWLTWAFDESGDGPSRTSDIVPAWRPPSELPAIPTGESPLPVAEADDEIIEIAWGGRDDVGDGSPILVPDIPDLSDQIPGPLAAVMADDDELETDVVMEPITTGQRRRLRRRSLVDVPIAEVLEPKITFRTPTGESPALRASEGSTPTEATTPTTGPVPVIPAGSTKITAMPPVPKPKPPPAWAQGTMPPKFKGKTTPQPRRRPAGTTGGDVLAKGPLADPSAPLRPRVRRSGYQTAQIPITIPAASRGQRVRVAAAIGAAFGLVVALTAFIVARGDGAGAPQARTASAATPAPAVAPARKDSPPSSAKLVVRSTPPGMKLVIDGEPTGGATPATVLVAPGRHRIALAKDGTEMWASDLDATAGTNYELHPVLETPMPQVPWKRVKRVSGRRIRLGHALSATARVCMSARGKVTSVAVPNADDDDAERVRKSVRKWRFKPYRIGGKRTPVCFDMPISAE